MPTRGGNPRITIQADAAPVERAVANSERSLGRLEASAHKAGQGLKVGVAAGAVAATAGLGAFVDQVKESAAAARESEISQSKLEAQLKALGISYKAHAKQIDEVIQKTSRLSGLDDEDLQDAFTNVVRATGNVNGALKDMSVVADLARAKHLDVAKAGDLVAKVHNGNVGVLKRYGVAIDPVTKAQDALKASTKKATDEQVRAAKEQDKQATAQKALAELTDRFSGQAKKYGDTTQGSLDKAGVAWENLHEAIGSKVTPVLAKAALGFVGLLDKAQTLGPPIKRIAGDIQAFGQRVIAAFKGGDSSASGFATRVRAVVAQVITFVRDLYTKIKAVFSGSGIGGDLLIIGRAWLKFQGIVFAVVGEIAKRVLPILTGAITGLATIVRGVVRIIAGILSGDWSKAWQGAKDVASGAVKVIVSIVKGLGGLLLTAAKAAGKAILNGLIAGLKAAPGLLVDALVAEVKFAIQEAPKLLLGALKGLGGAITKGITSGFGKLNPFGDGIGMPSGGSTALSGGNGLMGARPSMAPIAGAAARFGLHTSSGRRPGAITSSGNISYHSTGEALDEAGSPAGMMGFFNFMKNTAGGRLAELIYGPGKIGIKNGQPYNFGPALNAQHMDHVHVAIDSGAPGVGDGMGKGRTRGDEMGWLTSQWQKVAPVFGLDPAKRPLPSLFKHIRFSGNSPFVGVSSDIGAKGHGTDELLWPSWLWSSGGGQKALDNTTKLKLFIHEMAHRFQVKGATDAQWKSEGGAEAFARLAMGRFFGGLPAGENKGDPYNGDVTRVMHDLGTPWVTGTQFGRKAGTGDGIGFTSLESLWVQAGGSANIAPLMAHIAQAESGGNPNAMNRSGATGLWQILGKPFAGNAKDPLTNAKMAVWKYQHQGLGAWAASRGTWGRYVGSGETYTPGKSGKSASNAKGKTFKPGISNEPLGSLKVTGEDAGPDATALLSPPAPRTAAEVLNRSRPIKGYRPGDPITEPVDRPDPVIPGVQTEFSDTIRAQAALAALTPGTDDDLEAANAGVWNANIALDRAKASGNAGAIADTAEALKSAMDAVKALTDAVNQSNEIQQQRDQLNQTIADNQAKILALGNRTGDLQAQFAAWLSGSIGGRVGLGFQAAGVPGSVARY